MDMRDKIYRLLQQAEDLPTLPEVVLKVEAMARSEDTSAQDMARIMEHDPSLSARILKMANSVLYGGTNPVSSVAYAIARIGFIEIRNIALSLSVTRLFKEKGHIEYDRFWKHALSVAFASQILLEKAAVHHRSMDDLFTSGLLHDIGILVLDQCIPDIYRQLIALAQEKDAVLWEVEREVLQTDHAEAGAFVLKRWRLPDQVSETVLYHHQPDGAEDARAMAQVVHLANFTCNNQGIDNGTDAFPSGFSQGAWFDMQLSVEDIPAIIEEVNQETAKSELLLALGKG